MIPDVKVPAVVRALQSAFGVSEFESIRPLTGGLSSAQAFQITVKDRPYLLKILRTEVISNPAHEFTCMQAGARAGIAPHVWYAHVEDRVLITDFVAARPYPDDMASRMAGIIRKLHTLPDFPRVVNYLDSVDGFIQRFQAAGVVPAEATEELFRHYAELKKVYRRDEADLVASHNDLKPQNIVFDGARLFLVDWESAFLNDPYVDLAIAANFFVPDEAHEDNYLGEYFGEPPGEYRLARFYLMRQAVSIFYATLLLTVAARAGQSIDPEMAVTDFRAYHQDLIANRVDMLTDEAKVEYGLLHLRQALRNLRSPRFAAAVARVSGGPG